MKTDKMSESVKNDLFMSERVRTMSEKRRKNENRRTNGR